MQRKGVAKNLMLDEKRVFSVNLPEKLIRRVDRVGWVSNRSRSMLISEMIEAQIDALEQKYAGKE